MRQTPLYDLHVSLGGKMVDFAGWQMPLHYGSQLDEHHRVRDDAGVFDVSHMNVVDVTGEQAQAFLRYVLANDVAKLKTLGKALYSCMLTPEGGVIDDLIVYYLGERHYRVILNAATKDKDMMWLHQQAEAFAVNLQARPELVMLALQGPKSREYLSQVLSTPAVIATLKAFHSVQCDDYFIARTGYTGEFGYEILLPAEAACAFCQRLVDVGVKPVGLGARDTLRLEAGLNLYGNDMDEQISPFAANLAWTVCWEPNDRQFIGKDALLAIKATGVSEKLVGLVVEQRGVLRPGQAVLCDDQPIGIVTSGTFSPSMQCAIAFARIAVNINDSCQVMMRGKPVGARMVNLPFVRAGKILVERINS